MTSYNPKILVTEHYDSLIRQVDIHAEELLEKFTENKILEPHSYPIVSDTSEVNCLIEPYRIRLKIFEESYGVSSYHDPYMDEYRYNRAAATGSFKTDDELVAAAAVSASPANDTINSEKIRDYISRVRGELLIVLERLQAETLARCDTIRNELATIDRNSPDRKEKLKTKVFAQKFAFIQQIDEIIVSTGSSKEFISNPTPFKLYLFVIDLYLDSGALIFLKFVELIHILIEYYYLILILNTLLQKQQQQKGIY